MTQVATAPTETPVATTLAVPTKRREKKITWPIRLCKRLDKITEAIGQINESIDQIEPRQADKQKLDLAQLKQDLIDAEDGIGAAKTALSALPKGFFPKSRKRVLTVYQPGETLVLRKTAPETYRSLIADGEPVTIVSAAKQTLQLRTQAGSIVVGLASHFQRPEAPKADKA